MPDVTIRHTIETDEETFWSKIVFDEAFNKTLYIETLAFPGWRLVDSKEDDATLTRRVQVDPPVGDLPGPLKKVVGDRLAYTEDGRFDKKARRYTFTVTPSTLADKTKVSGEMWCETIDDKKIERVCRIRVEVKVFIVGGMLEDRISADLRKSYDDSTAFTNRYIRERGL